MSELTQKHPFLRARTSYFEAFMHWDVKLEDWQEFVRELDWRDYNRIAKHPEAIQFFGRDPFYNVAVITKSSIPKNRLRDIATDIYKCKYTRREVSLKRDA